MGKNETCPNGNKKEEMAMIDHILRHKRISINQQALSGTHKENELP